MKYTDSGDFKINKLSDEDKIRYKEECKKIIAGIDLIFRNIDFEISTQLDIIKEEEYEDKAELRKIKEYLEFLERMKAYLICLRLSNELRL